MKCQISLTLMKNFNLNASHQGWISSDERLPEELIQVLVYIPEQDHIASAIYEKKEGWYESYNGIAIVDKVSHWCNIPKPPKTITELTIH